MKRNLLLSLIIFSGIFAGFDLIYAQQDTNSAEIEEITQLVVENRCSTIRNIINDFNNLKQKSFTKKVKYTKEAYEKELDAYIHLENAVNCSESTECKDFFRSEIPENRNCKEEEEILEYSADEFLKSAKFFEEAETLYFGSNHLPLEKGNLDEIVSNNLITRAGDGFLYSSQRRLADIFRGSLIRKVNAALGTLAILYLFILGAKFIMARGETERLSELKGQFAWIVLGLFVISIAEYVGFEVLNPEKDVLGGTSDEKFAMKVRDIVRYIEYFAAGLMLINALISAYGLIISGEEEESISKEKQFLKSFMMGTAFILLAEVIVRILTFQNIRESATIAVSEVAGLVNFSLSFIGIAAVSMLVMSGLYYVISFGDEDQMGRAKKMIISSIIGVVIAFSAYTIVRFLII